MLRAARESRVGRISNHQNQGEALSKHNKTDLDLARDDLMSHIHRCGVLKAAPEHQVEWLDETIDYLGECYPAMSPAELAELKEIGVRFCQPVIPHGKGNTALSIQDGEAAATEDESEPATEAPASDDESESRELASV